MGSIPEIQDNIKKLLRADLRSRSTAAFSCMRCEKSYLAGKDQGMISVVKNSAGDGT